ncbi:hypothetical protein Tdes44962_MAKER05716 [Teratosphaeria destructans]|uniref:Uncharacterized protein n=1 Tax=Teratosphaeria destructans TaxID=418781 RepID=A0A9W7VYR7_9PEZI|nr:hypothetical protein Tdes44962_MAKER05716 [Teratosphaeria destructans]
MGLSSFWSQITGPRVKEITPRNRFSWEDEVLPPSVPITSTRNRSQSSIQPTSTHQQPVSSFDEMNFRRRSRSGTVVSVKKHKSDSNLKLKKRKSWFGGKAEAPPDIPSVPALPSLQTLMDERSPAAPFDEHFRPGTAVTTDEPITWPRAPSPPKDEDKKERRKSIFGRKWRSQSAASHLQPSTGDGKAQEERAPPLPPTSSASTAPTLAPINPTARPPLPTSLFSANFSQPLSPGFPPSTPPAPGFVPASPKVLDHAISHPSQPLCTLTNPKRIDSQETIQSKRRSLSNVFARSRSKSTVSAVSNKNKRRSWFASSNPDDDDDRSGSSTDIPQVPPLVSGNGSETPDSSVGTARSPDPFKIAAWAEGTSATGYRDGSISTPRAVSGLSLTARRRRSYTPKNAAGGFLSSTSPKAGGSDRRSSYRHSLLDDGDGGMICLSDEQQREWEKLKHLMDLMEQRQDNGVIAMLRELEEDEERDQRSRFSNAQALAALEFGEATGSGGYYD